MKLTPVYFQMSPQMLAPVPKHDTLEKIVTELEAGVIKELGSSWAFAAKYKANGQIPVKSTAYTSLDLSFKKKVCGGSHADIDAKDLRDTVVGKLLGAGFDAPLFAVVNHNSAHHLSYALAHYAFGRWGKERKRLVINFDQHDDYALKPTEGLIRCSTWGWYVTNRLRTSEPVTADAYVTIGQGQESATQVQIFQSGKSKATLPHLADGPQDSQGLSIGALMDAILKQLDPQSNGSWANWAVYLTFDRDMMTGSCTPYGDGHYTPSVARGAVKQCLAHLKKGNATLVGSDLMGLPTGNNSDGPNSFPHRLKPGYGQIASEIFAQAVEDCAAVYTELVAY